VVAALDLAVFAVGLHVVLFFSAGPGLPCHDRCVPLFANAEQIEIL
jgi:hypothetical protein